MSRLNITSAYNAAGSNKAIREMERLQKAAKKANDKVAASFAATSGTLHGISAGTGAFGASLTRGVTVPLTIASGVSVNMAGEFETSMNLVRAATGATETEMDNLSESARTMGTDYGFGARQSAQAMLELAKGGMSPAQIQAGALEESLKLAAAGGIELESASNLTVQMLGAFNMEAGESARIADALAGAANKSSADIGDLAQGLSQSSAVAATLGYNVNDTAGALALFADRGIKGSDAGTSLKTMLLRLNPQTDAAAESMKKYGLSFSDAQGNMLPLEQVADQLQKKFGHLSEAERTQALQTIFGTDAMRAAAIMAQGGGEAIRSYTEATYDKQAADKMALATTEGSAGSIRKAQAAMEGAAIVAGTSLAPVVTRLAGEVVKLATWFSELSPATQDNIVKFGLFAAAAGPLFSGVSKVTGGLGALFGWLGKVKLATTTATAAEKASTSVKIAANIATKAMAAGQWLLNAAMTANPIGLVVAGIALLVGAFVLAWKKSETFRNILTGAWDAIKNAAISIFAGITNFFRKWGPLIIKVLLGPVGNLVVWMVKNWDSIKAGAIQKMQGLIAWVKGLPGRIKSAVGNLGRLLLQAGKDILQGLKQGVLDKWNSIKSFFSDIGTKVADAIKGALGISSPSKVTREVGQDTGEGLKLGLRDKADSVYSAGKYLADQTIAGMSGAATAAYNLVTQTRDAEIESIEAKQQVKQAQEDLNEAIAEYGRKSDEARLAQLKLDKAKATSKEKEAAFTAAVEKSTTKVKKFGTDVQKVASYKYGEFAYKSGQEVVTGLINGMTSKQRALKAAIKELADEGVKGNLAKYLQIESPSRVTTKLGEYTGEGFVNGILGMVRPTENAVSRLAAAVAAPIPAMRPPTVSAVLSSGAAGSQHVTYNQNITIQGKVDSYGDGLRALRDANRRLVWT